MANAIIEVSMNSLFYKMDTHPYVQLSMAHDTISIRIDLLTEARMYSISFYSIGLYNKNRFTIHLNINTHHTPKYEWDALYLHGFSNLRMVYENGNDYLRFNHNSTMWNGAWRNQYRYSINQL